MSGIPRFETQISRVSVPSMQNFQQEQNEQIYKAVAGVANATTNIAEELYAAEQKHKAEVEGGKATMETDLNKLPTPYTAAQKSYNDAAIASFYSDFSVSAERMINESAFKNYDNPAQFLVETDAYINGVAKNIPDYLKKQVLRPIQMVRESKYDTLLRHKTQRNKEVSTEMYKFNLYKKRQNANFIASDEDLNNYLSEALSDSEWLVSMGASAKEAQEYLSTAQEDGLNRYLSKYYLKERIDPKEYTTFFKNVQLGKTGILALDLMPPERRINVAIKAFDDLNKTEAFLTEKNFTLESNKEAAANMMVLSNMSNEKFAPENPSYVAGYANKELVDSKIKILNNEERETTPTYKEKILKAAKWGSLNEEQLIQLKSDGILGDKDFIEAFRVLNSYERKNRELPAARESIMTIMTSNPDVTNEYGEVVSTNEKQRFLLEKLYRFLDTRELTNQEISDYTNQIIHEADTSFNDKNTLKDKFTKDNFYKKFGMKYDEVDSLARKYVKGNAINRGGVKKEIMSKYRVTSNKADALLTYWLNMVKMEGRNAR